MPFVCRMWPKTVLIADADSAARDATAELAMKRGYAVETTGRGTAAVELLRNATFACAIVDVVLDDMKGWDAVRILRAVSPRLPVIMTAAQNTEEQERRVRAEKVSYYHLKSFDPAELVEALQEVCGPPTTAKEKETVEGAMPKVLIVDDDPDFHEALHGILTAGGFQVVSAYSKSEGMEKVRPEKPDVIVLDIMMESLTAGFHFAQEIRRDPALKHIPILSASAVTEKTGFKFSPLTDEEFFPVDDFVEKPIRAKDLIARLNKLIGRKAAPT